MHGVAAAYFEASSGVPHDSSARLRLSEIAFVGQFSTQSRHMVQDSSTLVPFSKTAMSSGHAFEQVLQPSWDLHDAQSERGCSPKPSLPRSLPTSANTSPSGHTAAHHF